MSLPGSGESLERTNLTAAMTKWTSLIFSSLFVLVIGEDQGTAFLDRGFLSTNTHMLTLGQLSEPFQLLSQYSYGSIRECPDKFQMEIADGAEADFTSGMFYVPYSNVKIDLGNWYSTSSNVSDGGLGEISCSGPKADTVLTLQSGMTVSAPEFIRLHSHSLSTITLFKSLIPRLRTGNYWLTEPELPPFHCSRNGISLGSPLVRRKVHVYFFLRT